MTREIKVGDIWRRKNGDQKEVEVLAVGELWIEVLDASISHPVATWAFNEYFEFIRREK